MLAVVMREPKLAQQHFEHALRMAEQMPSPPFIAITSHQLGVVLDGSEDAQERERARTLFARAAAIAESHKLTWLRRSAGQALAKAFARYKEQRGILPERWGTRT
jgi:hypothetical protein